MTSYLFNRLTSMIVTLFLIITLTFFLMHAVPGGPFTSDKFLSPEVEKALLAKYHLDDPLWKQYGDYILNVIQLDLGPSFKYPGITVNEMIIKGLPSTLRVGVLAFTLVVLIGIPLGVIAALKHNQWQDRLVMTAATIWIAVPSFIIATVCLYIFALKLHWVPTFGIASWQGYILPVVALCAFWLAFIARLTRSSLLEVLQQDYMVTAKSKGLNPFRIFIKHGLKNAMIPIVTVLGPVVANLLTGSFVIEHIFAIPGVGRYFVQSISDRDYTAIMGITIFYAAFLILMIFIVDLIYIFLDPRIKLKK